MVRDRRADPGGFPCERLSTSPYEDKSGRPRARSTGYRWPAMPYMSVDLLTCSNPEAYDGGRR
jgi:hypothetical protein